VNLDVIGIQRDYVTSFNKRAKLDTGPLCNYDCEFCYYKDRLTERTEFEIIKDRVDYLYEYGIEQVDLSGGESSIHSNWFEILDYCKDKFNHISCLSHGGKFSDMDFLTKSVEHGLREILFSLHGASENTHDNITMRKGSFKKIIQAIKNSKQLGLITRTNATIYYKNFNELAQYGQLINELKPTEVNFLPLNYWGNKDIIENTNIDYAVMSENIKRCIDYIDPTIKVNVRYIPFCYMKGYEKHVVGIFQHIYDLNDWNRELYTGTLDVSKKYDDKQKIDLAYNACIEQRSLYYKKSKECFQCKNFYICDGIQKEVDMPVLPEAGEKIKDVNYYKNEKH